MQLFEAKARHKAVIVTVENLIMSGILMPNNEVARYMETLLGYTDTELGEVLCASQLLLYNYLEYRWSMN